MNVSTYQNIAEPDQTSVDTKSVALITIHATALVLFLIEPKVGMVLLGASVLAGMGLSRPMPAAIIALGFLWVNDVVADFYPTTRFTAWKDVLLLCLLVGWMARSVLYRRSLVLNSPICVAMLLLVLHFLVMCVQSPSVAHAVLGLKGTVFYMAWFFVVPDIVKTKRDVQILIGAVLFGTLCISAYNVWRAQQPWGTFPPQRSGKIWAGPLQAHFSGSGYIIPAGMVLAFSLIPVFKGWKRSLLFVIVTMSIVGLLMTFLRANWGATIAALFIMAVLGGRVKVFLVCLVLIALIAPRIQVDTRWSVADRAVSTFDTQDESREYRDDETSNKTIPFVLTHPLGTGTGSMTAVTSAKVWANTDLDYILQGGIIHNTFLLVAMEIGWTGLLCYIWLLYCSVMLPYQTFRSAKDPFIKNLALGLLGVSISFIVLNFAARMIVMPLISFLIWPLFGLIPLLPLLDKDEQERQADERDQSIPSGALVAASEPAA